MLLDISWTVLYFKAIIDSDTGLITALSIEGGTSVPSDDSTTAYQLLSNIQCISLNSVASVNVLGGGVRGSQNYQYCGVVPATDGSGHLFNS